MPTERSSCALNFQVVAVALAALSAAWLVPGDSVWSPEAMTPNSDLSDFVASGGLVPASVSEDASAMVVASPAETHTAATGASAAAEPTAPTRESTHADVRGPQPQLEPAGGVQAQAE